MNKHCLTFVQESNTALAWAKDAWSQWDDYCAA